MIKAHEVYRFDGIPFSEKACLESDVRELENKLDIAISALEEIKARAYYVRDDAEIYILAGEALSKLKDQEKPNE